MANPADIFDFLNHLPPRPNSFGPSPNVNALTIPPNTNYPQPSSNLLALLGAAGLGAGRPVSPGGMDTSQATLPTSPGAMVLGAYKDNYVPQGPQQSAPVSHDLIAQMAHTNSPDFVPPGHTKTITHKTDAAGGSIKTTKITNTAGQKSLKIDGASAAPPAGLPNGFSPSPAPVDFTPANGPDPGADMGGAYLLPPNQGPDQPPSIPMGGGTMEQGGGFPPSSLDPEEQQMQQLVMDSLHHPAAKHGLQKLFNDAFTTRNPLSTLGAILVSRYTPGLADAAIRANQSGDLNNIDNAGKAQSLIEHLTEFKNTAEDRKRNDAAFNSFDSKGGPDQVAELARRMHNFDGIAQAKNLGLSRDQIEQRRKEFRDTFNLQVKQFGWQKTMDLAHNDLENQRLEYERNQGAEGNELGWAHYNLNRQQLEANIFQTLIDQRTGGLSSAPALASDIAQKLTKPDLFGGLNYKTLSQTADELQQFQLKRGQMTPKDYESLLGHLASIRKTYFYNGEIINGYQQAAADADAQIAMVTKMLHLPAGDDETKKKIMSLYNAPAPAAPETGP